MPAPINLSEAALDLAQGDYGDLDAAEYLLEYAVVMQPPYLVAGVGFAISVLCGLTFAKLVQQRLEGWKQDRLALLPLGTAVVTIPYMGMPLLDNAQLDPIAAACAAAAGWAFMLVVAPLAAFDPMQ